MVEKVTGINYFDLDRLLHEAVERNFRGDGNTMNQVISQATYHKAWDAFTKWCNQQIDKGIVTHIANFGAIGFQPLRENHRLPYIKLNEAFLGEFGLAYRPEMEEFEASVNLVLKQPVIKPQFPKMAQMAQMERNVFHNSIMNIFQLIGELLTEFENVEIDLHEYGKLQCMNRMLMYAPMNKLKPGGFQGKQTVKGLMDLGNQRAGQLQPLPQQVRESTEQLNMGQNAEYYQAQAQFAYIQGGTGKQAQLQGMLFKSRGEATQHQVKLEDSPSRRFKKPNNDAKIKSELLGAGDDPMAKQQEYSLLAGNPAMLMRHNFMKPSKAESRFPPVIDPFSRTLAAPVSSQKHYLSVSHKIGTNFTPTAKGFYIDVEFRNVRYKDINDTGTKLDIVSDNDIQPADEHEEYEAYMNPGSSDPRRIKARKVSYNRYRQYVQNEISVDVIAPIRQYWLTHIIELIPGDLHAVEKEQIEYLIDSMLNEINKDYFDSVRKSILDYILMDENEMKRLGIQQVLNQPITWGDDFYKGIEPNEEWKHNVMMARMLMSENLCICSQATLELMRIWYEDNYSSTLLVDLLKPEDAPISLEKFHARQMTQIERVRNTLNSNWTKQAVDILRNELENLDKDQTSTFFDSVAALMSNQVRELTTKSINEYVDFFRQFRSENGRYPTPQEIVKRDYDPDAPFERTFMTLKMEIAGRETAREIKFEKELDEVRKKLVEIIDQMVERINSIPRADTQIANSTKTHLWDIEKKDVIVIRARDEINRILDDNLKVVQKALNIYDDFVYLLKEGEKIKDFVDKKVYNREDFANRIDKLMNTISLIKATCPYEIRCNMFLIQTEELNNRLVDLCEEHIDTYITAIKDFVFGDESTAVATQVREIQTKFSNSPKTTKELVEADEYFKNVESVVKQQIVNKYESMVDWLTFLQMLPQPKFKETKEEDVKQIVNAYKIYMSLTQKIEDQTGELETQRIKLNKDLKDKQEEFKQMLASLRQQISVFSNVRGFKFDQYQLRLQEVEQAIETWNKMNEKKKRIQEEERDLETPTQMDFKEMDQLKTQLLPYKDFYELNLEWHTFKNDLDTQTIELMKVEEIKSRRKNMEDRCRRQMNVCKDNKNMQNELKKLDRYIKELREKISNILEHLCIDGLRPRHKERINKAFGPLDFDILTSQWKTIESLSSDSGIKEVLAEIAFDATKEYGIERTITNIKADWKKLAFTTKPHKTSGLILDGSAVEELQAALDDHLIKTQTMKSQPFAKYFKEEIEDFEIKLARTQANLEIWLKLQQVWMYLEPVFKSDDIIKQMPVEGQKFREVDRDWDKLMKKVQSNEAALVVMEIDGLGTTLKDNNEKVEEVTKGLNAYLESKRSLFPRFYFLGNDELLSILSETKDPTRVQPHLKKCFEGINELDFDEEKKIHAMISAEGERVPFPKPIDPVACRGAVEEWLLQVEEIMIKSVKEQTERAMQDYAKTSRDEWVRKWQGMCVLCIAMYYWTQQAEDSMKKAGHAGLVQYYQKLLVQMEGLIDVVRSDISRLTRCTIEALVVLEVHSRDVVEMLVNTNVSSHMDFSWLKQLRYYWEESDVWVRITNSRMEYNYEYLGNSGRLVITPLTDRCYITLCGAVYLNYGGAPEGPAGTGKTETVKDLSKALARQCIVFNCSDGLDFRAMAKFFRGLASCGAWSCFDEFNRIDLEVLSVIAQQLQTIQLAVDAKKTMFDFDDSTIPLKRTCNCFITMNPGYAGRSELPDNLKALFRSVAMMVPDYAMIAEISLLSYGYKEAKPLAQKIVTTYTLCSEQLSSQKHYDYGMRAVKSVLTAAGNLKRVYTKENEYILMLRSINDVNLAKFLAHDIPLYKNITQDLFPGVVLPTPDYKHLLKAIENQITKLKLTTHEYFVEKIIQLYEMVLVRHGLMVVGSPFAGKTSIQRVLADALTELNAAGLMNEMKTHIQILNPKSVLLTQLYGNFDEVSHDWSDGILAVWFRTLSQDMPTSQRRWLTFDGPVDAVWIENMNTVLDDNKKLCLMSGEIIQMSNNMNMVFEPMDLQEASPATVSRCGMVYLQPEQMGWGPVYKSWRNFAVPDYLRENEHFLNEIDQLVKIVVQPCISYVREQCKEIAPTNDQNLIQALLRLWSSQINVFKNENVLAAINGDKKVDKGLVIEMIDSSFLFACIWSLCITVQGDYRKDFSEYLKGIYEGRHANIEKFPGGKKMPSVFDRGTIYDYVYFLKVESDEKGVFQQFSSQWMNWNDTLGKDFKIDSFKPGTKVQDIVVTTIDTIRYSYIQEYCIRNKIPTLFCGPTGTGKSVYIQDVLVNRLKKEEFDTIGIGFSAQTHCNQVQDIIDNSLKQRRRGVFGPLHPKRGVIFIDDLNMPKVEKYGAQPPIEILRQYMDQGGWYDRKDNKHPFRTLEDMMCIAAMGPPGGGKSFITPRFQRHFNLVGFMNFEDSTMRQIFGTILKWYFAQGEFKQEVELMEPKLVKATLSFYKKIQEDLKPTPAKSHYTFNLRDFSKVICGICLCTAKEVTAQETVMRLWAHEITRVFGDRLTTNEDMEWLINNVKEFTKMDLGTSFDMLCKHLDLDRNGKVETLDEYRGLLFGDIFAPFQNPDRPYEEILDKKKLQKQAEEQLESYNAQADIPMNLVLFNFAIEHLLRIGRILKQPGGHAMLIGVGGSGRQSLSKLASKITDMEVFQIEIKKTYGMNEFREDEKALMRKVGVKSEVTSFVITDNSIKQESFLEDINNILNTGEVPNIFPADEKVDVMEGLRGPAKEEERCPDGTPAQFWAYFIERCKKNLHLIICFSPIGDTFRNRVRNFPSLVNCTTMDWFQEWPPDALENVATRFLSEVEMATDVRESCVQMVQIFHTSTQEQAKRFFKEKRRHYYITPTSYLEMIKAFQLLLGEKRKAVMTLKDKYSNGYDTLIETEEKVNTMKEELIELQPQLVVKAKEVAESTAIVTEKTDAANIVKEAVSKEEAIAQESANAANAIKNDCESELAKALPALREATKALDAIGKADIAEMKGNNNPIPAVLLVMTAVGLLFGLVPEKKMNPQTQKKEEFWWPPIQKFMAQMNFLDLVKNYDKDGLTAAQIKQIQPYTTNELFNPDKLKSLNMVAMNFCKWVLAMQGYYQVNLIVIPKRKELEIANAEYERVSKNLKIAQDKLAVVVREVNELTDNLNRLTSEKKELDDRVEDCKLKLERAEKLISGLGGEKTRWKAASQNLLVVYTNLTGDVLISAGMIAYLGAFDSVYRNELSTMWVKKCAEKKIPNSGEFSLAKTLGDPIRIRDWNAQGLPSDDFSIENAIITEKTQRWPLYIDPQSQANKWIRKMYAQNNIKVQKFSDEKYLKVLETAIPLGLPYLIENVGEELDPAIEPILTKSQVKRGNGYTLKFGDGYIDYDPNFRFFMTTKLRNPHYLPEVSTKVTLLNFMITYEGLSDQLLSIIVAREREDLETQKAELVITSDANNKELARIEDQILDVLAKSKNILADSNGIEILSKASVTSVAVSKKQAEAKEVEKTIDEQREFYKPISRRTSGLFFCIQDLANIDPMYQYSLPFFIGLFEGAILTAPKNEDTNVRIENLNKEFTESLYRNICRSLFEKDKMIFSFLLCSRLLPDIDAKEFKFLLTGGIAVGDPTEPAPADWVSAKMWGEINRCADLPGFKGFIAHFKEEIDNYKKLYEHPQPDEFKFSMNAHKYTKGLKKLIVMRLVRPDKLVPAISKFVVENLGEYFINPPLFDLKLVFSDSRCDTPLIFVLSPGSDPMKTLNAFAQQRKKENMHIVSLGQGQGAKAERFIKESMKDGNWVCLQNCHLATSWMRDLEKLCEELSPDPKVCKSDFRLWLTSYPSDVFPASVLQNGVKMTNEAPKGLKSNLQNSFLIDPINNEEWFNSSQDPRKFRKLLFGLCFFHAVVQERRLYGPLGWNIQYGFNETDLRISVQQLKIFIDEYPEKTPFDALRYLTGECNYGGRVTDKHDRECMTEILQDFYCEKIFNDEYKFSPSGLYFAPKFGSYSSYIEYAKTLPQYPDPEVFGLHQNAAITKNLNETSDTLAAIMLTQQQASSGGDGNEDASFNNLADQILAQIPKEFNVRKAEKDYPVRYEQSMNSVVTQELTRFNVLIKTIRSSLNDLKLAIKGEILLSSQLEVALKQIRQGYIPELWLSKSYPSLKSLSSYIKDLADRLNFFQMWIDSKSFPDFYWINKFFFTQGFMTGALQNYARSKGLPIDTLTLDFQVIYDEAAAVPPTEGIHVKGMYMEGFRWNNKSRFVDESDAKVLFSECPMVWFKPIKKVDKITEGVYMCPLYRTMERKGVLATTGHSTNFVLKVSLPTQVPASHWTKRGAAMICSLTD